jgi:hypothetical protein
MHSIILSQINDLEVRPTQNFERKCLLISSHFIGSHTHIDAFICVEALFVSKKSIMSEYDTRVRASRINYLQHFVLHDIPQAGFHSNAVSLNFWHCENNDVVLRFYLPSDQWRRFTACIAFQCSDFALSHLFRSTLVDRGGLYIKAFINSMHYVCFCNCIRFVIKENRRNMSTLYINSSAPAMLAASHL